MDKNYILYAILFSDGDIKIGKTTDIREREKAHRTNNSVMGKRMVIQTFSKKCENVTEMDLADFCAKNCTLRHGAEYFGGIDFEAVKAFMEEDSVKKDILNFFGYEVEIDRTKGMISLNDIARIGNAKRASRKLPIYQMHSFLKSKQLMEFIHALDTLEGCKKERLERRGKGVNSRVMADAAVAAMLAGQMDVELHAQIHKHLIENKIKEFNRSGGTEFIELNQAIKIALPSAELESSNDIYVQIAEKLRDKILGTSNSNWGVASSSQICKRFEYEATLCQLLKLGVVRDYEHLKHLISSL